ncbi:universal stress protein [Saliphagus infecundisoli]|uniref:Universal stress protein n=1 Tax=Saliphagus infecundisoli TaxID=1849069 RepID=A0ABD5QDZ2_9EURY|nr:universal stress protein [Saliphagus infecundisoli]
MDGPILVPTDGSEPADAALEHAIDIAADTGATVHALYVADTNEPSLVRVGAEVEDVLEEEGQEVIEAARARAAGRGVDVDDRVIQGQPRNVILEYAATEGVSMVVMGAHGRDGIGEYLLGSTTERVANACEVPVLTVRTGEGTRRTYPYEAVLVPTDGSEHARAALELGAAVAARHGASLHLLSIVDELPETIDAGTVALSEDVERTYEEHLGEAAEIAREAGVEDVVTAVESGSVPREVVAYAEDGIDLVAMGTHGRSGLDRYLLGSFTDRVVRTSPAPVLTTRVREE